MTDSTLANEIITALGSALSAERVKTDADALQNWGKDWTKIHEPAPLAVVFPKTTEEVQAIVKLANQMAFALVPSGGRTGLSAGAVAANGEVVVSFDAMNTISDFSAVDRTVNCQAGVITEQLQQFAEEQGLFYPVDFASSGSSQIGGNIATNAGGIKVIRYGMTRDWVSGLTVVTGAGDVLQLNNGLLKNNTGYDFRHLFIGSEGTLGLITEATMRLTRPAQDLSVMVLGIPAFADVMDVLHAFQQRMDLTAFEFFSEKALKKVIAHSQLPRPFAEETEFYALLEFENVSATTGDVAMELFEHVVEQGWVVDGVISQSQTQAKNLWRLREDISETIARWTPYKNDISVKVSDVPAFLTEIDALVGKEYPDFEIIWFGHIGDGNLHLNILKPDALPKEQFFERCKHVSRWVFEIVEKFGGSVSAEHGVGMIKKDYLIYTRSETEIDLMRAMKKVFDPNGIMNPGKVID